MFNPRRALVESFCSFLNFRDSGSVSWQLDATLRQSILCRQEQLPPTSPDASGEVLSAAWASYLHGEWKSTPSREIKDFLWAYLEEARYGAAVYVKNRFGGSDAISEYCQMAIAKPTIIDKILAGFDGRCGSSLKNYAYRAFVNAIVNACEENQEVRIVSNWALLRRTSPTRLEESLRQAGYASEQIERYKIAHQCFNKVYVPTLPRGNRLLPSPTAANWEEIAQFYNRQQLSRCSAEELEKWITTCAEKIRAYLNPPTDSLNAPVSGREEGYLEDIVSSDYGETSVERLIEEEETEEETQRRESLIDRINSFLTNATVNLSPEAQQIIQMRYGEGLSQKQIGEQLSISQSKVSRQLTAVKQKWLLGLLALCEQDTRLHTSLTPEVELHSMNESLEQCLKKHYTQQTSRETVS